MGFRAKTSSSRGDAGPTPQYTTLGGAFRECRSSIVRGGPQCYNAAAVDAAARVSEFIGRERLLSPGQRVVLGVSGGADSLCLLGCLHQLGYRVLVAHLDHGWRSSSWADALFVLGLARDLSLPAVVERLAPLPTRRPASLEEKGREARYEFLARVASQHGIQAVAVGHTADDQVETVVMHWLRGAGPNGLRGILPETLIPRTGEATNRAPVRLLRPLLDLRRSATEEFCRQRGWEPRQDESNQDPSFLRNRIRAGLLPDLEAAYPGFAERVVHSAQLMRDVSELIDHLAVTREPNLVREAGVNALRIDRRALDREPRAIQREILRRALRRLRPDLRDIGFEAVENLLEVPTDAPRSLVGDVRALRFDQDWVLVGPGGAAEFPDYPQLRDPAAARLPVPGTVRLKAGWRLMARKRKPRGAESAVQRVARGVVMDAARLEAPLEVRAPRPGDRIRPLGMTGRIKVSDLLSQEHIPGPLRSHWPLVVSGPEVIWVAGVRMADTAKISRRTGAAIVLSLEPPRNENGRTADFTRRARLEE
jgi:tRNA(Ile)-lysidine synthase